MSYYKRPKYWLSKLVDRNAIDLKNINCSEINYFLAQFFRLFQTKLGSGIKLLQPKVSFFLFYTSFFYKKN